MSANSKIAWTDATWNPVRGCAKISAGCANCYAERFAERWRGIKGHPFEHGFDVRLVPGALDLPLRWRKPRKVFVNSMSDLFHEQVPDEYIHRVFAKMALADRHTFQVLTKRPERMRRFFEGWMRPPLPNVWLGVTAEDQRAANERIPLLLQTPAAVRFVSVEPMLGPVDLSKWLEVWGVSDPSGKTECSGLDWIIVGGESGPKARPFHIEWARSLLAQCREAGVPTFVKQAGAFACLADKRLRLKEPAGRDPSEWPDDMRVQEFPGGGRAMTAPAPLLSAAEVARRRETMSRHCALCRHCGLEADEHPCCECWRDPSHPMFSRDPDLNYRSVPSGKELAFYMKNLERQRKP